jgi:signal transduction histidine kinase
MTGNLLLDWAIQAVSIFNAIVTTWLGLTILLNAERRVWGIWVTGGGLLFAALFFTSHSVIISEGFNIFSRRVDIWWHIGWWPVIVLPLAWYLVTLWYAGFWERSTLDPRGRKLRENLAGLNRSDLYRRQRWPLTLTLLMAAAFAIMLLVTNPLPALAVDLRYYINAPPFLGGLPLLIITYPIYILLCIGLSFDALLRPGPSERMMGDLARRRARPWLITTATCLLIVSLLVAWVMFWVASHANSDLTTITYTIAIVDLIVATIIALAILSVGQAVVVYEVFTGKALPRHGLQRHWRRALVLGVGFATIVSAGLTFHISPIYQLVTTTALMIIFYALLSWRLFSEREHYMRQLRPFVASQRLYDHLLTPSSPDSPTPEADLVTPLRTLSRDILDSSRLVLAAVGPLAPLVGPPISDSGDPYALPVLTDLIRQLTSSQTICLALDAAHYGGLQWAVPLWSERGLIGVLFLGEKNDGGLYTQEEIEIARASGERLIDTRASAELAKRLMSLQRQRLTESQVVDRRARRVLHDDILPQLHTALLTLNSGASQAEAIATLSDAHRRISDLLHDLPAAPADVSRLGLIGALKHLVTDDLVGAFDSVNWHIDPEAERQIQTLPPLTAEVVFYAAREAMRNAAKYGRGAESKLPLKLDVAVAWQGGLRITVEDNGVGLESPEAGAAPATVATRRGEVSSPQATSPQVSSSQTGTNAGGSGSGLALHSTMLAVVGGTLAVEANPQAGTRVLLSLPRADL